MRLRSRSLVALPHPRRVSAPAAVTAITRAALAALATLVAVTPLTAQERDADAFTWRGRVADGRALRVYDINGGITVERGGREVEVRAEKRWRRGDPDDVTIVRRDATGGDVVVCALWNEAECTDDGIRSARRTGMWRGNDNDVSVHFTVRVPDDVDLVVHTVNGDVTVDRAGGEIDARTVNGSIEASSAGGPVRARTTNGSIRVDMRETDGAPLAYETVNGSITVTLPDGIDADVDASTVNGRISTDFPLTVQGRIERRRLRATLGDGGPLLRLKTVNGGITLRRP